MTAKSTEWGGKSRAANIAGVCCSVLVSVLLALPSVVVAHGSLVKSEPRDGAVLERSPEQVRAWFDSDLETKASTMSVLDSESRQVPNSPGGVDLNDPDHASMIVILPSPLPAGRYVVRWTATSAEDGDENSGEFTFEVR